MYRYPSPGSQGAPKMPLFEADEDPFDSGYYKRDTRRRYLSQEYGNPELKKARLLQMDQNDPAVQEALKQLEAGPESSPGNDGVFATGPSDFDPTGLRSSVGATFASLEKSLDAHMPDHLPTPVWVGQEEEIVAWHKERNLPVPLGQYYQGLKVPRHRRVAYW